MPEMDGIELARRATELDPDIKVMFITGFAAVALNPDSQAPKDAKVLSKPFHLRDLVNEVEKTDGRLRKVRPPTGLPPRPAAGISRRSPASGPLRRAPLVGRARSSAGEHYVDIVGVTGSIPVAPTTRFREACAARMTQR